MNTHPGAPIRHMLDPTMDNALPVYEVTGISLTNDPGLYLAIFRIYLPLCSYVLCAEIYFSTTFQPAPTEP
ncbi:MAG: hypothetical protein K8R19_10115 [Methanosarcinales archaeon]|nr:hypothetical protein [Methanosarcinales archaeon]